MLLQEIYKVKTRFHKSVQIEEDIFFEDYIPTHTSLSSLNRILLSLRTELGSRAWSIIGPYGSGKSAFILFLKTLLGNPSDPTVIQARNVLQKADRKLYKEIESLLPEKNAYCLALVSASRESLEYSILKALLNGLDNATFPQAIFSGIRKQIEALLNKIQLDGYKPSNDEVLKICSALIQQLEEFSNTGLLIVIDELGKNLEAASLSSTKDIFILQKLAEMASRTKKIPFILVTVLHQSFDRYASRLSIEARSEWSKIQGRFEDIAYVDSNEQTFRLIASCIQAKSLASKQSKALIESHVNTIFNQYQEVFLADDMRVSKTFLKTLKACLPLHPLTVMALVPLFKNKFAQNERSLFAFMTSSEPFSFSEFLQRSSLSELNLPLFSLSDLYDYLAANLSGVLMTTANSRKWLEIEEALAKVNDPFQITLLKTIGILTLLKDSLSFSINDQALACALNCTSKLDKQRLSEALETLQARSIVVFRKYSSSFVLWGGSDIDIEEKIQEVKNKILSASDIVKLLNERLELRPKVAKRHFLKTGTLRFFSVEYIDFSKLSQKLFQKPEFADGQILFLANPLADINLDKIEDLLRSSENHNSIIAVSDHAALLLDSFIDLLALDWLKKNMKELQGDGVALKEIEARTNAIEYQVRTLTDQIFFPVDTNSQAVTHWLSNQNRYKNISKRFLSNWLSERCDLIFNQAPVLKNELINRFRTSSTSTAARTNLLRGILENEGKERLNIEGFPAEYCMFVSLCLQTQIYNWDADLNYSFQRDAEKLEKSWQPLWNFLKDYLTKNSYRKVSILELYAELKKPPFGLREAVLPLVLVMFYKAFQEEIAVFSHGTFLAKVKDSDFELMAKAPKYYEIQFCEISGVKSIVFNQIIETFIQEEHRTKMKSRPKLLHIVKMLCSFAADLSGFVKTTAELESKTKAVRKVLLEAREPASLLYKDLPLACGYLPFLDQSSALDDKSAIAFVDDLRVAVQQLQRKEIELISRIESNIYKCFGIDHFTLEHRTLIAERAENIMNVTLDSMLKGFLVRIADSALDYKAWLESIGTMIVGKPPADWKDEDLLNYEKELAVMQARILKYERIALEIGNRKNLNEEVAQVSFISSNDHEVFKIIHLDKKKKEKAKELALKINDFIHNSSGNTDIDLILASLKECSVKYIKNYNSVKAEANSK